MKYRFSTMIKSIPQIWLLNPRNFKSSQGELGILPCFPHPTVRLVELHVSRPSCQYVPEQPGDPLFRVRLQPHHGTPPCSLGSSLLFWTKLPPNARFLDMDIKRILFGEKGRGMPGVEKKKRASYTTTICLRVGCVFSASQSLRHTKLMGEIV